MGLYGSPYDYIIHVALIATSHVLLITSFQPPLIEEQCGNNHAYAWSATYTLYALYQNNRYKYACNLDYMISYVKCPVVIVTDLLQIQQDTSCTAFALYFPPQNVNWH